MTARSLPRPDSVLAKIADYTIRHKITRESAYDIARYCLLDALACAFYALEFRECTKLLGPVVRGTSVPNGARVPGTHFELDPIKAAFDIGTAIRWLDYNDSNGVAEGGHLSDNLGAVLAVADYVSRDHTRGRLRPLTVQHVLSALIKAYEIQGVLSIKNSYAGMGFDYVGLVNIASTAVATHLLGGSREHIINALSNAWLDGPCLRLYRIGHNTGSRKSWASGDATSRGVMHGLFAVRGEMGYSAALSAPRWGFSDVQFDGKPIVIGRALDSHVVKHVLFKTFPAQIHTQSAGECAAKLHPTVKNRIADIKTIRLRTHSRAMETSVKQGLLRNPADRDHCLQYVVAIALLHGKLTAADYENDIAADPRIDALRAKMVVTEDEGYTRSFKDPRVMANPAALRIEFSDGSSTPEIRLDYPLGHVRRRREGLPLIEEKFRHSVELTFPPKRRRKILNICEDLRRLRVMPFRQFMDLLVK